MLTSAAKAWVALAGAIATALLGVFTASTSVGQILTIIAVVATAVVTYATPNTAPVNSAGNQEGE